jgi:hypothetical protein
MPEQPPNKSLKTISANLKGRLNHMRILKRISPIIISLLLTAAFLSGCATVVATPESAPINATFTPEATSTAVNTPTDIPPTQTPVPVIKTFCWQHQHCRR